MGGDARLEEKMAEVFGENTGEVIASTSSISASALVLKRVGIDALGWYVGE